MRQHIMRFLSAGAVVLALSGCMTFNHMMKHYSDDKTVTGKVKTTDGDFKVMDNAGEGRMMITFAGMGPVTQGTPPLPWVRGAAHAWLAETGRADRCTLIEGYLFQAPQYEFRYQCDTPGDTPAIAQ